MKNEVFSAVNALSDELFAHTDRLFDHPELGHQEFYAQKQVAAFLERHGFSVELGAGGVETSVRGTYTSLTGGPVIGICGEFDCLPKGHACAHHLQTGFALGAAVALKEVMGGKVPFTLVMYATPDEEGNKGSGKNEMIAGGCFKELDLALICHGGDVTTIDETSMALASISFSYSGTSTHPAAANEAGRPAWDAFQIAVHGLSYLRAHLPDGARINWAVSGSAAHDYNAECNGKISVIAYRASQLEDVAARVLDVLDGAAIMTETKVDHSIPGGYYLPKFRVPALSALFYRNAEEAGALRIETPRNKHICTDTGSMEHVCPTFGGRIAFAPKGTNAHSDEWLAIGKSGEAHQAVVAGAKTLAGMAYDFLMDPELQTVVRTEWEQGLKEMS